MCDLHAHVPLWYVPSHQMFGCDKRCQSSSSVQHMVQCPSARMCVCAHARTRKGKASSMTSRLLRRTAELAAVRARNKMGPYRRSSMASTPATRFWECKPFNTWGSRRQGRRYLAEVSQGLPLTSARTQHLVPYIGCQEHSRF